MRILTFILLFINQAFAMQGSFNEGTQFSRPLLENDKDKATTFNPKSVPGFTTEKPPETSIHAGNIDTSVATRISKNKAALFIRDSSQQRPRFEIDAEKDPLFVEADKVANNPEQTLKLQTHKQSSEIRKTHYTCLKGQDLFERKCTWTKVAVKAGTRQEVRTTNVYVQSNNSNVYGRHLPLYRSARLLWMSNAREHKVFKRSITEDLKITAFKTLFKGIDDVSGEQVSINPDQIIHVEHLRNHGGRWFDFKTDKKEPKHDWYAMSDTSLYSDVWHGYPVFLLIQVKHMVDVPIYKLEDKNTCHILEEMTDRGRCGYKSKHCIEGAETRMIEGTPVYADCWSKEAIYQCQGDFVDNCKHYLEKGCIQTRSDCKTYQGNSCVQWEQTFECIEKPGQSTSYRLTGKDKAYCMDGDCVDSAYVANNEMLQALSQMTILRQAEKDMKGSLSIFKGDDKRCGRSCIDFKDCCGNGNGWGISIGVSKCSQDEEQLATERQAGKCIMVGTYCANRKLGVCIKKKTSFCCFGSKLSRLLQEEGRGQLRLSFGSPENPNCRGFTPQELSRLDFSKMDLSELFEDIQKNFKPQSSKNITDSISLERLQQNMKNLSSGEGK